MRRDELRCHIYDSRNSLCLIDMITRLLDALIYDSRNSLCLIDWLQHTLFPLIYDSRNSLCLIDKKYMQYMQPHLR